MPVKTIARYDLLSAEVATTAKNVTVIVDKAPPEATILHILNDDMKSKISALEERSGKKAHLLLEETPAMADIKRDAIYNQMLQYVKGLKHSPLPDEAKAAECFYELLVQHNTGLTNFSYDIESHHINALLVDLTKPTYQEAITTLRLATTVTNLEAAQRNFETIYTEKIEQGAAFDLPQLEKLVSPIRAVLYEILVHMGTLERLDPKTYATIVNETNELITEVSAKVKARKTRKNKPEVETGVVV
jgi:hypothetical protein